MKAPPSYDPSPGTTIEHACKKAVEIAQQSGQSVTFDFKGIAVTAEADSDPQALQDEWTKTMQAQAEAWRNSPEGQQAADESKRLESNPQSKAIRLLAELPALLFDRGNLWKEESLNAIMVWLKEFSLAADHVGVKVDYPALIATLEKAGFRENEYVGQPPGWFCDKLRMSRYIMGQALNCMRMGMPPHPVTCSFVEKYFNLPLLVNF